MEHCTRVPVKNTNFFKSPDDLCVDGISDGKHDGTLDFSINRKISVQQTINFCEMFEKWPVLVTLPRFNYNFEKTASDISVFIYVLQISKTNLSKKCILK